MLHEYSMKSQKRRNHQRWLNRFCRRVNRVIENDELWQGRFIVRQVATEMEWFEDHSGGLLYCKLVFIDKKTGRRSYWNTNCLEAEFHMWEHMNNFIVIDCAVWDNEHPYQERKDYRNVSAF